MAGILTIWTIYDKTTSDNPGVYVLRAHDVTAKGDIPRLDCIKSKNLDELRAIMENKGLTRLLPSAEDDPVILETWL